MTALGRKRKHFKHLPQGVTFRHGSYYLRRDGKWTNLGPDLSNALHRYAARDINPHRPTFADLIDRFQATAMTPEQYKPHTLRSYRCWLKPLREVFGPQPLEDFQQQDAHAYRDRHKRKVTANRHIQLLGTLLTYAVGIGWIASNPMLGYKKPKSAQERRRKRTVQPGEWEALMTSTDAVIVSLIKVIRLTALRACDATGLRWEDVKPDGLHVTPQKTDKHNEGYGVPMIFSLDGELGKALAEMKRQPVRNLIWLFPNKRGGRMSVTTAEHRYADVRKEVGVKGLWLHDIRRTRITEIVDKYGWDAGQRIAGHLDAKSTAGYYAPDAIRIEGI